MRPTFEISSISFILRPEQCDQYKNCQNIPKVLENFAQCLIDPQTNANDFKMLTKWQHFAKSGHTHTDHHKGPKNVKTFHQY